MDNSGVSIFIYNQLKVNEDKTVALVLSSHNNRANHNITVIKIGDCDITPSPTSRNIGVIFDTEMSMVSHVKHRLLYRFRCQGELLYLFPHSRVYGSKRNGSEGLVFNVDNSGVSIFIYNQLKVNEDKTVALMLSSHNNRANHNITVIKIKLATAT